MPVEKRKPEDMWRNELCAIYGEELVQHILTVNEEDLLTRFLTPMQDSSETFTVAPEDRPILDSILDKLKIGGSKTPSIPAEAYKPESVPVLGDEEKYYTLTISEEDLLIRCLTPVQDSPETFEVPPKDRPILDCILDKLQNSGCLIPPDDE